MVKPAALRFRPLSGRLLLRRFARDRAGVSALEFALILPLMLALYIGGIQVSEGLSIDRNVAHVTSTLADLVTQSKSLSNSDIQNIFDASSSVMAPYSADTLQISLAEVYIDPKGNAKVQWSNARNTTAPGFGSSVTLPTAVSVPDSYVMVASASYPYTPDIGYVLTGTFNLSSTYYLKPRISECISTSTYTCP